jgi:acetyl-CoA/propionyl-CoA carboxylase biotin carboxyl carrier protein
VAPLAGTVHLATRTGDLVKADQVLATIHPAATGVKTDSTETATDAAAIQGEGA